MKLRLYLHQNNFSLITHGPKYVPPCQNRFTTRQSIDEIIQKEFQMIADAFKMGLNKNQMSTSDQRAKDFFQSIEQLLRQLYTKPLSPKLYARAQYEHRMIRNIQRRLKQSNTIIRPTDKSKVFHLGNVEDYHRKALEYMTKTHAYQQLSNG